MRKFTLFLMSLFLTVGAMAQTPVLELNADQIGTTYPKQLSDEDAAKVYELTDLTVAVRVITEGTSGRRGLFVTSDPTLEKNTDAEGTGSRYVAYGLNNEKLSYLASWKTGDRFTANNQTFTANQEMTCVYVINPTNGKCELYLDGKFAANWSGTNPNGFMSGYEIATPKMVKTAHADAKIYLGGGMSSAGAGEIFGGTILGVKVYSGALSASEIAAISFEDPELLAQAREAFNTAYTAAQTILNEAELNVTSTELPLQARDENEPYYLWCNKTETSEGSIHSLFDGEIGGYGGSTDFFHTNWKAGNNQPRYHYIEVDLGDDNKLSEFKFGYNTRNYGGGSDFPDKIYVLGSNEKDGEYTPIYSVESGLPQSAAARWDSEIVSSEIAYRYIRFNVDAERTYWHMSEFDMFTNNISVAPKYAEVAKEVAALKNIYDAHAGNESYTTAKLNEAAAAINALVEAVNAGTVVPEFSYENLDKPTFAKGGNTTKVAMIALNGKNQTGFTYTQGGTEHFNMPHVEAGKTYSLNLTYEMAWGDLAIFQIDKNNNEKKYGYYTCVWEANASPFNTLVRDNSDFMCEELGINSLAELEAISAGDNTYLTIPYQITIDENLVPGDIVIVRVMVGKKDNGAYNAKNIDEGGCLDLVFTVKDTPAAYTFSQVTSADLIAKTEPTYIAIKNLSATNHHWFVGNTGAAPYSAEEFTDAAIFIWEPTTDGFYLKKLDGTYLQKSASIITYGTIDNAAVFTTTNPTSVGTGSTKFNGDGDSQAYINGNDDANLVRFVNGEGAWINVQNAVSGTPKYNTGEGGWTIHYVYEIAKVEEFTVNISDAQFATFYAQKNVVLPENATAYIIDGVKDNNWLNLVEVTGVLPANTGIILYSESPAECKLTVTDDAATANVENNKLAGTVYNSYIAKEENNAYYILSKDANGNVGMYNPILGTNTARFKNGANKAYLVLPTTTESNPAAYYSFRFPGTTGIGEVKGENGEVKAIYDLTGRRVEAITAPGIYIVNGKKVLVK